MTELELQQYLLREYPQENAPCSMAEFALKECKNGGKLHCRSANSCY